MNKCLSSGVLFPLVAVAIAPAAYYALIIYIATEQRIACSISQAINIPYGSVSNISMLLFFVGALVIAISRMLYATVFCLGTTYTAWQERNSRETNNLKG
jgi:hypothetical protein